MRGTVEKRFWAKVDKFGPVLVRRLGRCWVWTAYRRNGYGRMGDGNRKLVTVTRVSWELAYGKIPEEKYILHKCDNPACVRPTHLFLGTYQDNVRDMFSKGRGNPASGDRNGSRLYPERLVRGDAHPSRTRPECLARGERSGAAKLTEEKVQGMRKKYSDGWTQKDLAVEYGLGQSHVSRIVRRESWAHVE